MPQEIQTIKFKLKQDTLDIPSNHRKEVHWTDFIVWKLTDTAGIKAFQIKIKSEDSVYFLTPPHQNGDIWTAEINHNAGNADLKYEILYWKTGADTVSIKDPIISIRPSTTIFNSEVLFLIVSFVLGALSFWGVSSFINKK